LVCSTRQRFDHQQGQWTKISQQLPFCHGLFAFLVVNSNESTITPVTCQGQLDFTLLSTRPPGDNCQIYFPNQPFIEVFGQQSLCVFIPGQYQHPGCIFIKSMNEAQLTAELLTELVAEYINKLCLAAAVFGYGNTAGLVDDEDIIIKIYNINSGL